MIVWKQKLQTLYKIGKQQFQLYYDCSMRATHTDTTTEHGLKLKTVFLPPGSVSRPPGEMNQGVPGGTADVEHTSLVAHSLEGHTPCTETRQHNTMFTTNVMKGSNMLPQIISFVL